MSRIHNNMEFLSADFCADGCNLLGVDANPVICVLSDIDTLKTNLAPPFCTHNPLPVFMNESGELITCSKPHLKAITFEKFQLRSKSEQQLVLPFL